MLAFHRGAMRPFLCLCSIALVVASGVAYGQTVSQLKNETPLPVAPPAVAPIPSGNATPEELRAREERWFTQCMDDWDAATHMTKKEWESTCRRAAVDKSNYPLDQAK